LLSLIAAKNLHSRCPIHLESWSLRRSGGRPIYGEQYISRHYSASLSNSPRRDILENPTATIAPNIYSMKAGVDCIPSCDLAVRTQQTHIAVQIRKHGIHFLLEALCRPGIENRWPMRCDDLIPMLAVKVRSIVASLYRLLHLRQYSFARFMGDYHLS
jgi:hypothetical protein